MAAITAFATMPPPNQSEISGASAISGIALNPTRTGVTEASIGRQSQNKKTIDAHEDFLKRADRLGCRVFLDHDDAELDDLEQAVEYLANPEDNAPIIRASWEGDRKFWTLGHDALGLALERWRALYERPLEQHVQMDMNTARSVRALQEADLFEANDAPEIRTLNVVSDHLWDHQLPRFANARGFMRRVGIDLHFPEDLSCNGLPGNPELQVKTRDELHLRLNERNRENPGSLLVPSWSADFPGLTGEGSAGWMVAGVSDLFVGNGLVGRDDLESTDQINTTDSEERLREVRRIIETVLAKVVENKIPILSFDGTARALLQLAGELTNCDRKEIARAEITDVGSRTTKYQSTDSAYEAFLNNDRCYMVGTAYGRTLATQAGEKCYFDTQDLAFLLRREIRDNPSSERRLLDLFRQVCLHTGWHIGIPAAKWREQRVFLLRLASVALYTSEYVRSFPDDLVRFLYDWQTRTVRGRGQQVSRDAVRKTLERSFQFVSFEEYQRVLLDSYSEFAIGKDAMLPANRGAFAEIHSELLDLRAQTLQLAQTFDKKFDQVCSDVVESSPLMQLARRQKILAWNNFRILNFYDSERLMRRALVTLEAYEP